MLLSLNGRKIYFDLAGPQDAPTVCFTHSLNSDGGMWVEQMVPLLGAGYRVLRLDMRGHGGSAPVDGDYTMDALAADVKGALDVLGIKKVHYIGRQHRRHDRPGLRAGEPGPPAVALTLCDTQPSTPPGSAGTWEERKATVRSKGLAALADGTMERWFTDEFKKVNPVRWPRSATRSAAPRPQARLGCMSAIQNFDYRDRLSTIKAPTLVICGDEDRGHAARPQQADRLEDSRRPLRRHRQGAPPAQRRAARAVQSHHDEWLAANR